MIWVRKRGIEKILAVFWILVQGVCVTYPFRANTPAMAGEAITEEGSGQAQRADPPQKDEFLNLMIYGFADAGISINPAQPYNGINFGQLYTDQANIPQLNQTFLTIERPFLRNSDEFDYQIKIQTLYGSDARFHHVLGETEYLLPGKYQLALVEAYTQAHFPAAFQNGFDLRIGQFISYNAGVENVPSIDNLFYTRSYIYNAGPAQHVGINSISHINDFINLYLGIDSGTNTSIGWPGDNNAAAAVQGGVEFNLPDQSLTIAAFTHAGPENPKQTDPYHVGWPNIPTECGCDPNTTWRYYNNLTISYTLNDYLRFITDIAYYRDDGWNTLSSSGLSENQIYIFDSLINTQFSALPQRARGVSAFGIAQYASFTIDKMLTLNGRIEFWRDANNFFTVSYPRPFSSANQSHGFPADVISQPFFSNNPSQGTSYLATTIGTTFRMPLGSSGPVKELIIRPEARIDIALNNAAPFIGSNTQEGLRTQKTFSIDALIPFELK